MAIGASTTYGMSADPADSSWVNLVRGNLGELYQTGTVYNLGVPGRDCYHAMPDGFYPPEGRPFPLEAKNVSEGIRLLDHLSDPSEGVIIVSYASNNYQTYSIDEILHCLQVIYNVATEKGHRCLISTTQPRHDKPFESWVAKRKLAVIKDSIISRFGESSLNFYDGFFDPADSTILPLFSIGDKIHYNTRGHKELFRRVMEKISPVLSVVPDRSPYLFYPNPVRDRLSIDRSRVAPDSRFIIFDLVGRTVWAGNERVDHIDMQEFPAGVYYIRVQEQGRAYSERILKN